MKHYWTFIVVLGLAWLDCSTEAAPIRSEFDAKLIVSQYKPEASRDPFGDDKPATAISQANPAAANTGNIAIEFRLDGIMYHPTAPAAVVNGKLLRLGQPVNFEVNGGKIPVTAIKITREQVVLGVAGKNVDLWLNLVPKKTGDQP